MTLHSVDYNGGQIYGTLPPHIKEGEEILYKNGDSYHYAAYCNIYDKYDWIIKLIAQSPNLSLPNIPYVEIEEDLPITALKRGKEEIENAGKISDSEKLFGLPWFIDGYITGYKASAKKYTEEDLKKAFDAARETSGMNMRNQFGKKYKTSFDYIQSLQPKVVSIEVETELVITDNKDKEADFELYLNKEVPVTYTKDGKIFLKVKKVNHE